MEERAMPGSLGAAIKARRQQLGWSQEELAQRVAACGDGTFRQSDVSRVERGKVTLPHRARLAHIAAVLGLPLGELLARSGWMGAELMVPARASVASGPAPADERADGGEAMPAAGAWAVPRLLDERRRATALIAQAQATRERSLELVQRCEATHAQADQVLGTVRRRPSVSTPEQR